MFRDSAVQILAVCILTLATGTGAQERGGWWEQGRSQRGSGDRSAVQRGAGPSVRSPDANFRSGQRTMRRQSVDQNRGQPQIRRDTDTSRVDRSRAGQDWRRSDLRQDYRENRDNWRRYSDPLRGRSHVDGRRDYWRKTLRSERPLNYYYRPYDYYGSYGYNYPYRGYGYYGNYGNHGNYGYYGYYGGYPYYNNAYPYYAQSTAELRVYSNPSGAEVHIEGVFYGYTPGTFRVPAGRDIFVELYHPYYNLWRSREVYLSPGGRNSVSLNMR